MNVTIISERPTYASGFGTVIANLLRFGNWSSPPNIVSQINTAWKEMPVDMGLYTQYSASSALGYKYYVNKLNTDVVVVIGSVPHLKGAIEVIGDSKIPLVSYVTFENGPFTKDVVEMLEKCNLILTPSTYSKDIMVESGVKNRIEVVRHGVDTDIFRKIEMKKEHDFLYYGDNNVRKQIPRLLEAFSGVVDKKNDASLMLATSVEGNGGSGRLAENLLILSDQVFKLERGGVKRLHFNPHAGNVACMYDEQVNNINSSKIYVNASAGEAFNLSVLECAACGVPSVIADKINGVQEFLGDVCVYANTSEKLWFQWGFLHLVDVKDMSDKMYGLLTDKKMYNRFSKKAMIKAKSLTWNEPALQFKKYVEEIGSGK